MNIHEGKGYTHFLIKDICRFHILYFSYSYIPLSTQRYIIDKINRAGVKQTAQVGMCIHGRLRSVCKSAQSDQSLMGFLLEAKSSMFL